MSIYDVLKNQAPAAGSGFLPPNVTLPNAGGAGYAALDKLKALRQQLEAGTLTVKQFMDQGQPLAELVFNEQLRLGAGGSASAKQGDALRNAFQAADTGFRQNDTGSVGDSGSRAKEGTKLNLPEKYQAQIRDASLPANITPEQKQQYQDQIPSNIPVGTDRFAIEQEGLRQKMQGDELTNKQQGIYADEAAKQKGQLDAEGLRQKGMLDTLHSTQKDQRQQGLDDLASLLAERDNRRFQEAIPQVAEAANTKGIFRSTGFGEALAREYKGLSADTDEKLRMQGITDRNTYVDSASDALDRELGYNSQGVSAQQGLQNAALTDKVNSDKASLDREVGYQGAGLDRQFSVKDGDKSLAQMKSLADLAQPKQSGKSGAETAATVAGLGVNGAQAYYGAGGMKKGK